MRLNRYKGMSYHNCKKCKKLISKYTIDRNIDTPEEKNYKIKLCWGCGYFSIYPNVVDDFTTSILNNKNMIIDLIDEKLLRPIL